MIATNPDLDAERPVTAPLSRTRETVGDRSTLPHPGNPLPTSETQDPCVSGGPYSGRERATRDARILLHPSRLPPRPKSRSFRLSWLPPAGQPAMKVGRILTRPAPRPRVGVLSFCVSSHSGDRLAAPFAIDPPAGVQIIGRASARSARPHARTGLPPRDRPKLAALPMICSACPGSMANGAARPHETQPPTGIASAAAKSCPLPRSRSAPAGGPPEANSHQPTQRNQ